MMRVKILLASVLLLSGVAATAAPPPAPTVAPNPADIAFMESLVSPPAFPPSVGTPEPQWKSCNVSNDCGPGSSVSCTGNSTCQTTQAGVKCDGVEKRCPNYCSLSMGCQCCNGNYYGFCSSRAGNCQNTANGISCDGFEVTCDMICPFCPEW